MLLVEGAGRLLTAYPESLSEKARRQLEGLGATTLLRSRWSASTGRRHAAPPRRWRDGADTDAYDRLGRRGVGVAARRRAGPRDGGRPDSAGRITVEPDLTLPGRPEVLVLGDMVRVSDGAGGALPLPGVAQPAIQEGRYAAEVVRARRPG